MHAYNICGTQITVVQFAGAWIHLLSNDNYIGHLIVLSEGILWFFGKQESTSTSSNRQYEKDLAQGQRSSHESQMFLMQTCHQK